MAWSWTTFTSELGRILDDESPTNPAHSQDMRLDAVNMALRAMLAYRPKHSVATFSNVSQFSLPADCYRIEALVETWEEGGGAQLAPVQVGEGGGYWVWNGQVTLPETADSVTLYYQAYYPVVTAQTADIPVPEWAREAVLCRAAAYCLTPNQASRARLGAYHDRQDANPLDNSLIQTADWLIRQFERIMAEHKHAS